jgi:hypothetical protein
MGTNSAILQSPWELRLFPPARSLVDALFPRRLHRLAYLLRALPVALGCGFLEDNYTAIPLWWLLLAFVPGPNFALALILVFRAPCFPRPPAPPEPTPPIENRAIA